jgi:hypothetical protein
VAFDALTAFVFRNSQRGQDAVRILGRAYAAGTISVSEIGRLLSVQPADVVAALERYGFQRPIDTILLRPEDREEVLGRIRHDRLQRGGIVQYSAALVRRDVVASERIEGVDARRWLAEDP